MKTKVLEMDATDTSVGLMFPKVLTLYYYKLKEDGIEDVELNIATLPFK